MANTSEQANDNAERQDKKEMNSSAKEGRLTSDNSGSDSEPHIQPSETEGKGINLGRTPGKAEGVEDAEERGNQ